MTRLEKFDISTVSRKLNSINYQISVANSVPFPPLTLLSSYRFKKKPVKIMPNGDIQGGLCKMITSLIDFSFIRSLTAPLYSIKGPPPYDPPTLFLLELFRYIENYPSMTPPPSAVPSFPKTRMQGSVSGVIRKTPTEKKIFGYNVVLSTSVELDIKLELPVAVTNIPGNAEEGKKIIDNKEQIMARHDCETKFDIADAKYDTTENYEFLREKGSIPVIDYNSRNENLSEKNLRERGYDRNGRPFAPCGIKTRHNGFDKERQRHTFCCFKQCLDMKATGIKNLQEDYDIGECPYVHNRTGYSEHIYIADNPRLYNEIPRGTDRYNEIKRVRSASERANSTLKENLDIINTPIVYNRQQADVLAQIGAIVLLLRNALLFIAKTSALFLKYKSTKDPNLAEKLMPHYVPPSIRSLIQRE